MKTNRFFLIVFAMILTTLSGLGATPSKPDFAFPKTVSANAEADLKIAVKEKNGPAILNALIRYSLARTAVDPENTDEVVSRLEKVEGQVSDSVTIAMIRLLLAEVSGNDTVAYAVWKDFAPALRRAPVTDWTNVVVAEPQFFPSLYDFAAVKAPKDDVADEMLAYYASRPLPRLYWCLNWKQGFEELLDAYESMKSEPESAFVLARLCSLAHTIEQRRQAYVLACGWLDAFPSSPYRADVDTLVSTLCSPSMTINAPGLVGLGRPLPLKISVQCLNACSVRVEQVKGQGSASYHRQLRFDGSGVFESDSTLELTFDNYGVYRITPVFTGQSSRRNRDYIEVVVSDLLLWQTTYGSTSETFALDVINGAPQSDVRFTNERNRISAVRGNDRFTPSVYGGYHGDDNDTTTDYTANILTDRGLYHPGDSLKFVAVLIASGRMSVQPVAGRSVRVELCNPNWQIVDSLTLISDNFGRITGEFNLPADGLTGNFYVRIPRYTSSCVTVTDYKAPSFEVKADCERLSDTSVRVSGSAIGYNGFPLADAKVAVEVRTLPRWVWWRNFRNAGQTVIATDSLRTDADGNFSVVIDFPAPGSDVSLSVTSTVASPTGETHDAAAFVPARPYYISARIPQFFVPGAAPAVEVLDSRGRSQDIPLKTELISAADSLTVIPDSTWSNIPSGEYRVIIRTENPDLAEPYETSGIYVYRPTDKMPPARMALFVPERRVAPGDKLLVGTSFADSHILKTLWDGNRIISREWLTPDAGNFFLDITLPDSVRSATLSLATLRDYRTEELNVNIIRPDVPNSLTLKFSSFRDRMVPGERERWSISVADNLGNPVEAAVMLDVYSKALDAIRPFNWDFYVYRPEGHVWNLNYNGVYPRWANAFKNVRTSDRLSISAPSFNLYGRGFPRVEEIEYMLYETLAVSAAPQHRMLKNAARGVTFSAADGAESVEEEKAADHIAAVGSGVDAGNSAAPGPDSDSSYRLPELPVALWAPVLTSAPDGSLRVEFEAPDANTTWKLICRAYDMSLLTGSHSAEIIAAKPVMVQPNVPRFLRVGDRTELRAMVMNATDSAALVNSVIEIFDPLTAEVFSRREFSDSVAAGKSALISLPLVAPDRSMLGIRVKATSGNFTDGEQSVIAILPAVITARSATPLFFAADSTDVTVEAPAGSVVTLTTNAAWECLTALPGLAASESKSAFAATSALFSAAVGRGLVRTYPQIASALKRWEDADSALISKLSANEDLKIALLSETPWPAAAQSDTERMARLILLLDRKESQSVIDNAVASLAKLVRKGGLAWTPDSDEPSLWVTEEFLSAMARLRRLGYMPSSSRLDRIVAEAVRYLDNEIARDYAKYKGEYPDYAELRSAFPEVQQPAPARRAMAATVQYLLSHWRDFGFSGKAQAAIILNSNGYASTARTVIESLRQYEAWRQTGLNAELLDAFAAVEPRAAEVDEIRRFFIERKQAMEWGDGLAASALIASILSSGSDWLVPAENEMTLRLNGKPFAPEGIEAVMGSFRVSLPDGGRLEMQKGRFPAWGGVFTALTDTVTEIPAFASEKLSVTRRIEGDLSVGSRVKLIVEIDAAQPIDYVVVKSPRAAGLSVVNQLPERLWLPGSYVYREPCSTETNWFFSRLAKGKTVLTEEFFVSSEGTFLLAPAEAQSQYAPEFHSRTSGSPVEL